MWPFKPAPPPPEPTPPAAVLVAQVPEFIAPPYEPSTAAVEYRFGAIFRDREQRVAEKRDRHPEHDRLTGEAMQLAGMLLQRGQWSQAQVDERLAALRGIG